MPKKHLPATVYLSGRLISGWQDTVMTKIPEITFIDPRSSGLNSPRQYTAWNLTSIDLADILFAYMEMDNPSGYGIALEVGYARARGKHVVMVDERSPTDQQFATHFATVRASAQATFDSLDEAIGFLRSLVSERT